MARILRSCTVAQPTAKSLFSGTCKYSYLIAVTVRNSKQTQSAVSAVRVRSTGFRVLLLAVRNGMVTFPCPILLHERSRNNEAGVMLLVLRFSHSIKFIETFGQTFEVEFEVPFVPRKSIDIADDTPASHFLGRGSTTSCLCPIRTARFVLCYSAALPYIENVTAYFFNLTLFRIICFSNPVMTTQWPYLSRCADSWNRITCPVGCFVPVIFIQQQTAPLEK